MVNIIHLNTLLVIMIMLSGHYVYLFRKELDILIHMKIINQQWLLWLKINNF